MLSILTPTHAAAVSEKEVPIWDANQLEFAEAHLLMWGIKNY